MADAGKSGQSAGQERPQEPPAVNTGSVAASAVPSSGGTQPTRQSGPLHTPQGDTTIEDTVVQKLAGLAAREVPGVYAMGNAARRALSSVSGRITGAQTSATDGVSVDKGERQAAIDVSIVVEYGYSIVEVSQGIRRNVIRSVENATGLEVLEVNIDVTDVHLPNEDSGDGDDNGNQQAGRLE